MVWSAPRSHLPFLARQLARAVHHAADFQQILVNEIENQIAPEHDHADAVAEGCPLGRCFGKIGKLPAPGAQLLNIGDGARRIVSRDEIADLLDVDFRPAAEAKTHQALAESGADLIIARYLASSRSSTVSPSSAERPLAWPSAAR